MSCIGGLAPQYARRPHRRKRGDPPRKFSPVSIFRRLLREKDERTTLVPLYAAVVAHARTPAWYREGAVPDTLDGRFDMVAAILSLVLIRLEGEGEAGKLPSSLLTELFIQDMDGQLRELGIGDVVVGKHIGKMMSALGGRLSAYRAALAPGGDPAGALARNLYRGAPPADEALAFTAERIMSIHRMLEATAFGELLAGRMPAP